MHDDLLTTHKAAIELGCADHHVRRLSDLLHFAGRITVIRLSHIRLIRRDDLPLIREELARRPGWVTAATATT